MDRDNNRYYADKRSSGRYPDDKREVITLTEKEKDEIYIKRMLLKTKLLKK